MENELVACGVRLRACGEELILQSVKHEGLAVTIPLKQLEAWALRRMREEALQPAKNDAAAA